MNEKIQILVSKQCEVICALQWTLSDFRFVFMLVIIWRLWSHNRLQHVSWPCRDMHEFPCLADRARKSLISDALEHSNSSKAHHYQKLERLKRDICSILFYHKLATPVIRKAAIRRCRILQTTRLVMNNFCLSLSHFLTHSLALRRQPFCKPLNS